MPEFGEKTIVWRMNVSLAKKGENKGRMVNGRGRLELIFIEQILYAKPSAKQVPYF